MVNERLKNYLIDNQDLIKNKNYDKLYSDWIDQLSINYINLGIPMLDNIVELTNALLNAGIEFYDYTSSIPAGCFYGLDLYDIELPDNIKEIDESAFFKSLVSSIVFPKHLKQINWRAFTECKNLKWIWVPKTLRKIEDMVFNLSALDDVYYEGNEEDWSKIIIGVENDEFLRAKRHYNSPRR